MTVSKLSVLDQIETNKDLIYRDIDTAELDAFLDAHNLNWTVSKRNLQDSFGNPANIFGVYRDDTQHCFGSCKDEYTPCLNSTMGTFALAIADALKVDPSNFTSRQFDNGAVRILTIETREHVIGGAKRGDKVGEYLMIVDSYDKSRSFGISFGHIFLSCTNGMTRLDKKGYISLRHSGDLNQKIKEAASGLRHIKKASEMMLMNYEKMMLKEADKKVLDLAWKHAVDLRPLEYANIQELGKQRREAAERFSAALSTEIGNKGNNYFGVFSGVTRYTTEETDRKPERMKAKYQGRLARTDLRMYNDLVNRLN